MCDYANILGIRERIDNAVIRFYRETSVIWNVLKGQQYDET